ncbi:hypothetical protein ACFX2I_015700 [Malus domestica]
MDCFTIDYVDGLSHSFTQLSCCVSQLDTLMMNIYRGEYNAGLVFPILTKLKHLELVDYADHWLSRRNAVELVMYLIEIVVGLDKIVVDSVKRCVIHPTGVNRTQKVMEEEGEQKIML